MDTISGSALARALGTSVPRISRAVERLGIDARQANGRLAFTASQASQVRRALGVTPRIEGFTRPEAQALAALRSAPFGLVSARAVARRGGLSPTAAARALRSLLSKNLVIQTTEVIAAGKAREAIVWRANVTHRHWSKLDPELARVEPPARLPQSDDRVPFHLRHLFWNTADSQLDVNRAGPYIARRLLRTMDLQGLAWGARMLTAGDWRQGARARGLDPTVKQLARNLAANAKIEDFDASRLRQLARPTTIAGLKVASLQDLMAMKLKVMAERGEMRDYFDVKAIDEAGTVSVEEGIDLYMKRYGISPSSEAIDHLYRSMGDLTDVEADESLPVDKPALQKWWARRQAWVLRNSSRFG